MKSWQGYWCYLPIIMCLLIGYTIGGYLSFGVKYLNAFPEIHNPSARLIMMLFGMGILGASTYSSRFWAEDVNEVVYENEKFLPHLFDFFGYASMIVEGGITGVVLFLLIQTGVHVSVSTPGTAALNLPASLVIAYCGGLFHFAVVKKLSAFVREVLNEQSENKGKPSGVHTKER